MPILLKDIEERIYTKRGNMAAVARSFGVSREAIYKRVRKSAKLQAALAE